MLKAILLALMVTAVPVFYSIYAINPISATEIWPSTFSELLAQVPGPPVFKANPPSGAAAKQNPLQAEPGHVVDASAYGFTVADLRGAISAIGAEEKTLHFLPGHWRIDSDLTIPANLTLRIERGAVLSITRGATLTINGPLLDCSYQIFADANTDLAKGVKFGRGCGMTQVRPEWWGAKGNGDVNQASKNRVAINQAVYASPGRSGNFIDLPVVFGAGSFLIDGPVQLRRGTQLRGAGGPSNLWNSTCIYLKGSSNTNLVEGKGKDVSDVVIEGLTFCGGYQNALINGIYGTGGARKWTIRNCFFYAISGYGIYLDDCFRVMVYHNFFQAGDKTGGSGIYAYGADSWINGNELAGYQRGKGTGTGIMAIGGPIIMNNIIFNYQRGITIGGGSDTQIIGNRCEDNIYGIYGYGMGNGGSLNIIMGNILFRNTSHGIYADRMSDCIIKNNIFRGNEGDAINMTGSCERNIITNNEFFQNKGANIAFAGNPEGGEPSWIENNKGVDIIENILTLPAGASPSVVLGKTFKTNNSIPTVITNLAGGLPGKEVIIIFGDNHTTVKFSGSASLKGHGGKDWNPALDDHMRCVFSGKAWFCECFSNRP